MDLFLKFLILGGKYLTQLTAQSIVEAYRRSLQLGRTLNSHVERTMTVVGHHDNVLEMYMTNLDQFHDLPNAHLAFISEHHRHEFECYTRDAGLLPEECMAALLKQGSDEDASAEGTYVQQMAHSILGSCVKPKIRCPSPEQAEAVADDSAMDDLVDVDIEPHMMSQPPCNLAAHENVRTSMCLTPPVNALNMFKDSEYDTTFNSVAEYLDRQAAYIKSANDTFKQLQVDIANKYEQMREQQFEQQEEDMARDRHFAEKLKAVQLEVETCTMLMKKAQDHFDVHEEDKKTQRLFGSIDKIIEDVGAITLLMQKNEEHFKKTEEFISKGNEELEQQALQVMDVNSNEHNKTICKMLSQQLRRHTDCQRVYSTATTTGPMTPIKANILSFLAKDNNKEREKLIEVNQKAFEKMETMLKYPLIGRWNNHLKKSRKTTNLSRKTEREKKFKRQREKKGSLKKPFKYSKSNIRSRLLGVLNRSSNDELRACLGTALSSSWAGDIEYSPSRMDTSMMISGERTSKTIDDVHPESGHVDMIASGNLLVVDEKLDKLVEQLLDNMNACFKGTEENVTAEWPMTDHLNGIKTQFQSNTVSEMKNQIDNAMKNVRERRTYDRKELISVGLAPMIPRKYPREDAIPDTNSTQDTKLVPAYAPMLFDGIPVEVEPSDFDNAMVDFKLKVARASVKGSNANSRSEVGTISLNAESVWGDETPQVVEAAATYTGGLENDTEDLDTETRHSQEGEQLSLQMEAPTSLVSTHPGQVSLSFPHYLSSNSHRENVTTDISKDVDRNTVFQMGAQMPSMDGVSIDSQGCSVRNALSLHQSSKSHKEHDEANAPSLELTSFGSDEVLVNDIFEHRQSYSLPVQQSEYSQKAAGISRDVNAQFHEGAKVHPFDLDSVSMKSEEVTSVLCTKVFEDDEIACTCDDINDKQLEIDIETDDLPNLSFQILLDSSAEVQNDAVSIYDTEQHHGIDTKDLMKDIVQELNEKNALLEWQKNNSLLQLAFEMNEAAAIKNKHMLEQCKAGEDLKRVLSDVSQNKLAIVDQQPNKSGLPKNEKKDINESLRQNAMRDIKRLSGSRAALALSAPTTPRHKCKSSDPKNRRWGLMKKSTKNSKSYTVVKTKSNEITLYDMISGGSRTMGISNDKLVGTRQICFNNSSENVLKRLKSAKAKTMLRQQSKDIKLIPMILLQANKTEQESKNSVDQIRNKSKRAENFNCKINEDPSQKSVQIGQYIKSAQENVLKAKQKATHANMNLNRNQLNLDKIVEQPEPKTTEPIKEESEANELIRLNQVNTLNKIQAMRNAYNESIKSTYYIDSGVSLKSVSSVSPRNTKPNGNVFFEKSSNTTKVSQTVVPRAAMEKPSESRFVRREVPIIELSRFQSLSELTSAPSALRLKEVSQLRRPEKLQTLQIKIPDDSDVLTVRSKSTETIGSFASRDSDVFQNERAIYVRATPNSTTEETSSRKAKWQDLHYPGNEDEKSMVLLMDSPQQEEQPTVCDYDVKYKNDKPDLTSNRELQKPVDPSMKEAIQSYHKDCSEDTVKRAQGRQNIVCDLNKKSKQNDVCPRPVMDEVCSLSITIEASDDGDKSDMVSINDTGTIRNKRLSNVQTRNQSSISENHISPSMAIDIPTPIGKLPKLDMFVNSNNAEATSISNQNISSDKLPLKWLDIDCKKIYEDANNKKELISPERKEFSNVQPNPLRSTNTITNRPIDAVKTPHIKRAAEIDNPDTRSKSARALNKPKIDKISKSTEEPSSSHSPRRAPAETISVFTQPKPTTYNSFDKHLQKLTEKASDISYKSIEPISCMTVSKKMTTVPTKPPSEIHGENKPVKISATPKPAPYISYQEEISLRQPESVSSTLNVIDNASRRLNETVSLPALARPTFANENADRLAEVPLLKPARTKVENTTPKTMQRNATLASPRPTPINIITKGPSPESETPLVVPSPMPTETVSMYNKPTTNTKVDFTHRVFEMPSFEATPISGETAPVREKAGSVSAKVHFKPRSSEKPLVTPNSPKAVETDTASIAIKPMIANIKVADFTPRSSEMPVTQAAKKYSYPYTNVSHSSADHKSASPRNMLMNSKIEKAPDSTDRSPAPEEARALKPDIFYRTEEARTVSVKPKSIKPDVSHMVDNVLLRSTRTPSVLSPLAKPAFSELKTDYATTGSVVNTQAANSTETTVPTSFTPVPDVPAIKSTTSNTKCYITSHRSIGAPSVLSQGKPEEISSPKIAQETPFVSQVIPVYLKSTPEHLSIRPKQTPPLPTSKDLNQIEPKVTRPGCRYSPDSKPTGHEELSQINDNYTSPRRRVDKYMVSPALNALGTKIVAAEVIDCKDTKEKQLQEFLSDSVTNLRKVHMQNKSATRFNAPPLPKVKEPEVTSPVKENTNESNNQANPPQIHVRKICKEIESRTVIKLNLHKKPKSPYSSGSRSKSKNLYGSRKGSPLANAIKNSRVQFQRSDTADNLSIKYLNKLSRERSNFSKKIRITFPSSPDAPPKSNIDSPNVGQVTNSSPVKQDLKENANPDTSEMAKKCMEPVKQAKFTLPKITWGSIPRASNHNQMYENSKPNIPNSPRATQTNVCMTQVNDSKHDNSISRSQSPDAKSVMSKRQDNPMDGILSMGRVQPKPVKMESPKSYIKNKVFPIRSATPTQVSTNLRANVGKAKERASSAVSANKSSQQKTMAEMNPLVSKPIMDLSKVASDMIRSGNNIQYLMELSSNIDNTAYANLLAKCYPEEKKQVDNTRSAANPLLQSTAEIDSKMQHQNKVQAQTKQVLKRDKVQKETTKGSARKSEKSFASTPSSTAGNNNTVRYKFENNNENFIDVQQMTTRPVVKTFSKLVQDNLKDKQPPPPRQPLRMPIKPREELKQQVSKIKMDLCRNPNEKLPEDMQLKGSERERNLRRLIIMEDKINKLESIRGRRVGKDMPVETTLCSILEEIRVKKSSKFPEPSLRRIATTYNDSYAMGTQYHKSYCNVNSTKEDGINKVMDNKRLLNSSSIDSASSIKLDVTSTRPASGKMSYSKSTNVTKKPISPKEKTPTVPMKEIEVSTKSSGIKIGKLPEDVLSAKGPWKLPISRRKNLLPNVPELKNMELVAPKTVAQMKASLRLQSPTKASEAISPPPFRERSPVSAQYNDEPHMAIDVTSRKQERYLADDKLPTLPPASRPHMPYALKYQGKSREADDEVAKNTQFDERKSKNLKFFQGKVKQKIQEMNHKPRHVVNKAFTFTKKAIHPYTNTFGRHLVRLQTESERDSQKPNSEEYHKELAEKLQKLSSLPRVKEKIHSEATGFVYHPPVDKGGIRDFKKPSLSEVKRTIIKHLKESSNSTHSITDETKARA